jgi:putative Holliday junction resolvase
MIMLGVDFGSKRIGVAKGDDDRRIAQPLVTLTGEEPLEHLRKLVKSEEAKLVVIGLPRGLDGQETEQTAKARNFAKMVETELAISVELQDEAGTSGVAEDRLKASGRAYEAADIDAEAACIILQDYLDNL